MCAGRGAGILRKQEGKEEPGDTLPSVLTQKPALGVGDFPFRRPFPPLPVSLLPPQQDRKGPPNAHVPAYHLPASRPAQRSAGRFEMGM